MYSMYDNKAEVYNKPLYMKTWKEIEDSVINLLEHDDGKEINAIDYEIYHMGEYCEADGKYNLFDAPKHIIGLNQLINKGKNNEG